jgi:hypothetical protein
MAHYSNRAFTGQVFKGKCLYCALGCPEPWHPLGRSIVQMKVMRFDCLPKYPSLQEQNDVALARSLRPAVSPLRVIFAVGLPLTGAGLLYCIWQMLAVPEPLPLAPPPRQFDFELVRERAGHIKWGTTRAAVEEMLGTPSQSRHWLTDSDCLSVYNDMRGRPEWWAEPHVWCEWSDPNDDTKWVAVFFAHDVVRYKVAKGF